MDLFLDRPIMPIVLNFVASMQAAHPHEDLSVLIGVLEKYVEAEKGKLDALSIAFPPRSQLYPCLGFVLPLLADRVERQPKAWPFLLAVASVLFQFYHLRAITRTKETQERHASFNRVDEFLSFVEPMDRIARTVASSKDHEALSKACKQVAAFTTQQLKAFTYHRFLRGLPQNVFYQRTRRLGATGWLHLAYGLLNPDLRIKTAHHPLVFLQCAERSVPALDGLRVQHAFALSLLLPSGPGQQVDKDTLQSSVKKIPVEILHTYAETRIPGLARSRKFLQLLCRGPPRHARACKSCKRPVYCSEQCQRGDWDAKHRDICAVWIAVDERSRTPAIKRRLKALEDYADVRAVWMLANAYLAPSNMPS